MRPSVDLTLFGALWRQYLEYYKVITQTYHTTLDILLPGLPVYVSIKMSVDDHLVASLASPWDVVLVPQVERITFKLYPGAASQVVIEKTVHSLKKIEFRYFAEFPPKIF